jgi:hypothetical protein
MARPLDQQRRVNCRTRGAQPGGLDGGEAVGDISSGLGRKQPGRRAAGGAMEIRSPRVLRDSRLDEQEKLDS